MTDLQWNDICDWVRKELSEKGDFTVGHHSFPKRFDLSRPYYSDMVRRAEAAHPGFYFECPLRDAVGDPFDPIQFSKSE